MMINRFVCVLLLCFIMTSKSNRLDPNVFRQLSQSELSLPRVGNSFGITFSFNTYDNMLVDAHSTNATFSVRIRPAGNSPSVINLFIPMEEVNIKGTFQSSLELPIVPLSRDRVQPTVTILYNSGTYRATMARVHLMLTVHMTSSGREPGLRLHYCHPFMEEIAVQLDVDPPVRSTTSISGPFLREMMNMISKEEYGDMFCKAMKSVLVSENAVITQAILNRIRQQQYPKSA